MSEARLSKHNSIKCPKCNSTFQFNWNNFNPNKSELVHCLTCDHLFKLNNSSALTSTSTPSRKLTNPNKSDSKNSQSRSEKQIKNLQEKTQTSIILPKKSNFNLFSSKNKDSSNKTSKPSQSNSAKTSRSSFLTKSLILPFALLGSLFSLILSILLFLAIYTAGNNILNKAATNIFVNNKIIPPADLIFESLKIGKVLESDNTKDTTQKDNKLYNLTFEGKLYNQSSTPFVDVVIEVITYDKLGRLLRRHKVVPYKRKDLDSDSKNSQKVDLDSIKQIEQIGVGDRVSFLTFISIKKEEDLVFTSEVPSIYQSKGLPAYYSARIYSAEQVF